MSSATTTGSSQVLTDVGRPGLVDIPDGPSAAEARRAPLDVLTVERARDGETDAFEMLVAGQRGRLLRVASAILRDPYLAEDALQQALLDMWRGLGGLREADRFEAWSTRILVRECRREARRRSRWPTDGHSPSADIPQAVDDYGIVAQRDLLEHGFQRLSADHRAVIVLHHLHDLPLPAVATALGIPVGTARSRYSRAMRALRAALAGRAEAMPPVIDHAGPLHSGHAEPP